MVSPLRTAVGFLYLLLHVVSGSYGYPDRYYVGIAPERIYRERRFLNRGRYDVKISPPIQLLYYSDDHKSIVFDPSKLFDPSNAGIIPDRFLRRMTIGERDKVVIRISSTVQKNRYGYRRKNEKRDPKIRVGKIVKKINDNGREELVIEYSKSFIKVDRAVMDRLKPYIDVINKLDRNAEERALSDDEWRRYREIRDRIRAYRFKGYDQKLKPKPEETRFVRICEFRIIHARWDPSVLSDDEKKIYREIMDVFRRNAHLAVLIVDHIKRIKAAGIRRLLNLLPLDILREYAGIGVSIYTYKSNNTICFEKREQKNVEVKPAAASTKEDQAVGEANMEMKLLEEVISDVLNSFDFKEAVKTRWRSLCTEDTIKENVDFLRELVKNQGPDGCDTLMIPMEMRRRKMGQCPPAYNKICYEYKRRLERRLKEMQQQKSQTPPTQPARSAPILIKGILCNYKPRMRYWGERYLEMLREEIADILRPITEKIDRYALITPAPGGYMKLRRRFFLLRRRLFREVEREYIAKRGIASEPDARGIDVSNIRRQKYFQAIYGEMKKFGKIIMMKGRLELETNMFGVIDEIVDDIEAYLRKKAEWAEREMWSAAWRCRDWRGEYDKECLKNLLRELGIPDPKILEQKHSSIHIIAKNRIMSLESSFTKPCSDEYSRDVGGNKVTARRRFMCIESKMMAIVDELGKLIEYAMDDYASTYRGSEYLNTWRSYPDNFKSGEWRGMLRRMLRRAREVDRQYREMRNKMAALGIETAKKYVTLLYP